MATNPRPTNAALGTLFGGSGALTILAVYQWFELLELRNGKTPACSINATFNCATVWNSALASLVHEKLGMPMAGLGIVYGGVGVLLAALIWRSASTGGDGSAYLAGSKLWAAIGVLSCVTFIGASLQAGAVCLTCLGTYTLTAVYAFGAFKLLPPPVWPTGNPLVTGGAWALVLATPLYLGMLGPGGRVPKSATTKVTAVASAEGKTTLAQFEAGLADLPERDKLQISYARSLWLTNAAQDNSMYPVRVRKGPANAPVRIVDFTDILCGHCRIFEANTEELLQAAPEGSLSIEPRHFPLDGECNPEIPKAVGDGVRCLGAKLQICLEQHPAFFTMRHELFENQPSLTKDVVMQIATKHSGKTPEALMACVDSAETAAKLRQDIEYARRYHISGTPLVLLNDRESPPVAVFLLGMALAGGDSNAAVFAKLPPPPRPRD